jgi:hypothetical protein
MDLLGSPSGSVCLSQSEAVQTWFPFTVFVPQNATCALPRFREACSFYGHLFNHQAHRFTRSLSLWRPVTAAMADGLIPVTALATRGLCECS